VIILKNRTERRRIKIKRFPQFLPIIFIAAFALPLMNCGEESSSSSPSSNPAPHITSISPLSAPEGSRPVTLTVNGSSFISSSVVRWNNSEKTTTYVNSWRLTASIEPDDLANAGTAAVTVFNPSPGGGTSGSLTFTINSVEPLSILTPRLPDAHHGKEYDYTLKAEGGIPPYSWALASGTLPAGMDFSEGRISGTPPVTAGDTTINIEIELSDYAYQPDTVIQPYEILLRAGNLARNDTCSAATPFADGVIRASVSPYGDIDVYSFQGTAGSNVWIETYAQRLDLYADSSGTDIFMDSFLELLDSGCNRLTYDDDIVMGISQDSRISNYSLPYTGTYYIRVSDLRGDGRPDLVYELHLSGGD
jgi:hypothetical protein